MVAGLVGLIGYGIYKNMTDFTKQVIFKLAAVKFNKSAWQDSGFLTLFFDVNFQVTNPSTATVILKSAEVEFTLNGKYIGRVIKTIPTNIYPNSTVTVSLPVRVSTMKVFSVLDAAVKLITLKQPVKVGVSGVADFGIGKLKINETATVTW